MSFLMPFLLIFLYKYIAFMFSYLSHFKTLILLSFFTFWYSITYLGNLNWEVLTLVNSGKLFTTEFLTVTNTLSTLRGRGGQDLMLDQHLE